ncbi:ParA family protein [Piscinibacter sp.]|jgi:chromosome partitioning protein|uniref:ParA family protein n=1 Tax=Piscinibacter sp. TaxID=1903157 RepID=UPI00355A95C4
MPVIAVVNRKGGSGKSTLATHLAAYCANSGIAVMLGDVDRQQSTQTWLRLRVAQRRPAILGWAVDPKNVLRSPAGISHVILDTPGGLRGLDLARVVMSADAILMPVCNSVFDRASAAECYTELMTLPRVASGRCTVAAVGMRLDGRTKAGEVLKEWAAGLGLPFIGVLRETQAYVRCVEQGLTLFDLPAAQAQADIAQWQPILQWLGPQLQRTQQAADPVRRPTQPSAKPSTPRVNGVKPVQGSVSNAARPATQRKNALAALAEPPGRPSIAVRIGNLLNSLRMPRFRQRNS